VATVEIMKCVCVRVCACVCVCVCVFLTASQRLNVSHFGTLHCVGLQFFHSHVC